MSLGNIRRGIEITTNIGCKVACIYCPQRKLIEVYCKRSDIFNMSFEIFKKCIDKVPDDVIIDFAGMSEPWLNPETSKMVSYASAKHSIHIYTTLSGVKFEDIDLIESIKPERFVLHLPADEGYEKIEIGENYLLLLEKLIKSKIFISAAVSFGANIPLKVKALLKNKKIIYMIPHTRALNVNIINRKNPERLRGKIYCKQIYACKLNVLLPNGDVVLCCMDYGMKHVLGNLLSLDYDSLFKGKEFFNVEKGLHDESIDILCRYCEEYASCDKDIFPKIYHKIKRCLPIYK